MFTIVMAEQNIISSIDKYELFLKPLLQGDDFAFCELNLSADNIDDMVPSLRKAVCDHDLWRAIVIHSGNSDEINPFNFVRYSALPEADIGGGGCRGEEGKDENENKDELKRLEYLRRRRAYRFSCYEKAMENPMVKLSYALCGHTDFDARALSDDIKESMLDESANYLTAIAGEDPEFYEYALECAKKSELFGGISESFRFKAPLPREVIFVGQRCCDASEYRTRRYWEMHYEHQYSRFSEFNMFPDKPRYLVFDLQREDHRQYEYDYIRFLCFILILARGGTTEDAFAKNKVYRVCCENDDGNLSKLLSDYDLKLEKTYVSLLRRQQELMSRSTEKISDKEARGLFSADISVQLRVSSEVDLAAMRAKYREIGLSGDCPMDESLFWGRQYFTIRKAFQKFLKEPRRALGVAVEETREQSSVANDDAMRLDTFQVDDIAEDINDAEQEMVSTVTSNIYDTERYNKRTGAADRKIRDGIAMRMTRRTTIAVGAASIAVYFFGFLPMLLGSLNTAGSFLFSVLFSLIACALFAAIGVVALCFLRHQLVKLFKNFNEVAGDIIAEISDSMAKFSRYLSRACKFMRGYSVINYVREEEDKTTTECKILKKHMLDIRRVREECAYVFSRFMRRTPDSNDDIEEYRYDFSKAADYTYPLPHSPENHTRIEFLLPDKTVEIPVNYVKSITMVREELFDD